jgi:hypothetical protein
MTNKRKSQTAPHSLTDRIPHGVRSNADGNSKFGDFQQFSGHKQPDSSAKPVSIVYRLEACAAVAQYPIQIKFSGGESAVGQKGE